MTDAAAQLRAQLAASIAVKQALLDDPDTLAAIVEVAGRCAGALRDGRKLLFAGNGGSAADAQHIAAELVGRFILDRPALAAMALTTDTSLLTSVANDYGYPMVFRRQLQGLARPGDVFVALSTSGNSENLLAALDVCPELGVTRVGLTGESGGNMLNVCDICIRVPARETARIQEVHITIGHILCSLIEQRLFASS